MKSSFISVFLIFTAVCCSDQKNTEKVEQNEPTSEISSETVNPANESPVVQGKELVESSDCRSCHQTDSKLIGPSYQEIAAKYSDKDLDLLATKIIEGGQGNWGEIPMAPHVGLSKENAQKMVKYILSQKK